MRETEWRARVGQEPFTRGSRTVYTTKDTCEDPPAVLIGVHLGRRNRVRQTLKGCLFLVPEGRDRSRLPTLVDDHTHTGTKDVTDRAVETTDIPYVRQKEGIEEELPVTGTHGRRDATRTPGHRRQTD